MTLENSLFTQKGDKVLIPDDISSWLKICGALCTAVGSMLLAWRVKKILKWVVYCLAAHEESLFQFRRILRNERQTGPLVEGVTTHLLDIESKLGVILLVTGFSFLSVGMFLTASSFFFGGKVQ